MDSYLEFKVTTDDELNNSQLILLNSMIEKFNNKPDIKELVLKNDGELFSTITQNKESFFYLIKGRIRIPTQLFQKDIYDFTYIMENWIDLLSSMRNLIKVGTWIVSIDNTEFPWSEEKGKFVKP